LGLRGLRQPDGGGGGLVVVGQWWVADGWWWVERLVAGLSRGLTQLGFFWVRDFIFFLADLGTKARNKCEATMAGIEVALISNLM